MNIEPGTRVRHIDPAFPALMGDLGTYVGTAAMYHVIQWDDSKADWNDLHLEGEFEVIDE